MDDTILYNIINNKKNKRRCDDKTCIEFIPNKFKYCYHHYDLKIKNNTPKNKKEEKSYSSSYSWQEYKLHYDFMKTYNDNYEDLYISKYKNILFEKTNTPKKNKKTINKEKPKQDQEKEAKMALGRIKKSLELLNKKKINKENIYNINRRIIDTYSYLYNNMHEYDSYIDINVDGLKIDKNKSRFSTISKLFNIIKNTPELYNSEYIFNYYTFKKINNEGLDFMIKNLNELCYNENNKYWSIYKNHIEYDDYYDKIIEYEINKEKEKEQEEDYEDSDYDGFVNPCVFCENTEDLDPSNGICNECKNKMSKYNK